MNPAPAVDTLVQSGVLGAMCVVLLSAVGVMWWALQKSQEKRVADSQLVTDKYAAITKDATAALEKNASALDALTGAVDRGQPRR